MADGSQSRVRPATSQRDLEDILTYISCACRGRSPGLSSQRDLEDILTYIATDKPSAAVTWVHKLEAKCLLIASSPEIGEAKPELGVGVRASVVGRYVIFHRRTDERVEILRVIPGDRNITEL